MDININNKLHQIIKQKYIERSQNLAEIHLESCCTRDNETKSFFLCSRAFDKLTKYCNVSCDEVSFLPRRLMHQNKRNGVGSS